LGHEDSLTEQNAQQKRLQFDLQALAKPSFQAIDLRPTQKSPRTTEIEPKLKLHLISRRNHILAPTPRRQTPERPRNPRNPTPVPTTAQRQHDRLDKRHPILTPIEASDAGLAAHIRPDLIRDPERRDTGRAAGDGSGGTLLQSSALGVALKGAGLQGGKDGVRVSQTGGAHGGGQDVPVADVPAVDPVGAVQGVGQTRAVGAGDGVEEAQGGGGAVGVVRGRGVGEAVTAEGAGEGAGGEGFFGRVEDV
jgi:hypothetical protein